MKIKYKDKKVKKQCEDVKTANKCFGQKIAEKLFATINFIQNANNLRDIVNMPTFHFHGLAGKRNGEYAIDIDGRKSGFRLIVIPLDDKEKEIKRDSVCTLYDCASILLLVEVTNHYD